MGTLHLDRAAVHHRGPHLRLGRAGLATGDRESEPAAYDCDQDRRRGKSQHHPGSPAALPVAVMWQGYAVCGTIASRRGRLRPRECHACHVARDVDSGTAAAAGRRVGPVRNVGYTRRMAASVLLLDNTLHPGLLPLGKRWAVRLASAARVDVVHAPTARELPDIRDYTHLILTGSEASVLKPPSWVRREAELVRTAADGDVRILGSCFGHELLVWALSGPESLTRAARPEFGWTSVDIVERDSLLCDVPSPWTVFAFHVVEVVSPPRPWRVLATSRRCATHILRYGERPIWGIQAHPEITRRSSEFALRAHLLVTQHRGGLPRTTWGRVPADLPAVSALMTRFLTAERAA